VRRFATGGHGVQFQAVRKLLGFKLPWVHSGLIDAIAFSDVGTCMLYVTQSMPFVARGGHAWSTIQVVDIFVALLLFNFDRRSMYPQKNCLRQN